MNDTKRPTQGPKLRLVADEFESALEDVDDDLYAGEGPAPKAKLFRLPRSKKPFTRIFHSWLTDHELFPPLVRLLMVLVYRSHEGVRPVELTAKVAAEAHLPSRKRSYYARWLERLGAVSLERDGQGVLTVTVLLKRPR